MTAWLDLLWLFFLLGFASWALAVSAASLIVSMACRAPLTPSVRARRALLIAWLPWLAPVTIIASACLIAASKQLGWITDHCIYHGSGHPHLCFEHLPSIGLNLLHALCAGLALGSFMLVLIRFMRREHRMTSRVNALRMLARGRRRLRILEDDRPFAFAAGPGNAFVLLSRGLLERLSLRERRIVLAHEIAHLRHRDPARNLMFGILLLLHLPGTARSLRGLWRQALEEQADDRVAARYGREDVAGTLLNVLRISHTAPMVILQVAGADPLQRVQRLLSSGNGLPRRSWRFELAYLVLLVAVAVSVIGAHHPLESLLGLVTGA